MPQLLSDNAHKILVGTYVYVPVVEKIREPFFHVLKGLLTLVVQDLRLTLTPQTRVGDVDTVILDPGMKFKQTTDSATGAITVYFGDVASGQMFMVIFNLKLLPSDDTEMYETDLALLQHTYTTQSGMENGETQDLCITRDQPATSTGEISQVRMRLHNGEECQGKIGKAQQMRHNEILIRPTVGKAQQISDCEIRLTAPEQAPVQAHNATESMTPQQRDTSDLLGVLCAELQHVGEIVKWQDKELDKQLGHPADPDALASEASHGCQPYDDMSDDMEESDDDMEEMSLAEKVKQLEKDFTEALFSDDINI
jgi:hypothetical protein